MLEALRRVGRPRLVGGGVRDWLLGLAPKDLDVEVAGVDFETLQRALAPFGATDVVGRSFGVVKVRVAATGAEYDFSLPRRESKIGAGHRGFAVAPDPDLDDAAAAARRDFTLNAIAYDPLDGAIIDPHGGQADLAARRLRHTSAAFGEDPLRVLRAFQLAARFDLTLAPETAALCRTISGAYAELPVERVWGEWDKWATKAVAPSRGLAVLEETGWLRALSRAGRAARHAAGARVASGGRCLHPHPALPRRPGAAGRLARGRTGAPPAALARRPCARFRQALDHRAGRAPRPPAVGQSRARGGGRSAGRQLPAPDRLPARTGGTGRGAGRAPPRPPPRPRRRPLPTRRSGGSRAGSRPRRSTSWGW